MNALKLASEISNRDHQLATSLNTCETVLDAKTYLEELPDPTKEVAISILENDPDLLRDEVKQAIVELNYEPIIRR